MASRRKRTWIGPDGKQKEAWVVEYTDAGGTRRRKTCANAKAADAFRAQVTIDVSRGEHTPDTESVTIGTACDNYIRLSEERCRRRDRVSPQSLMLIKGVLKNHVVPYLGNVRLNRLTAAAVQRWVDDMQADKVKPRTAWNVKEAVHYLRQVLVEAQRRGHVARNVIRDAPPRRPTIAKERVVIPEKDEIRRLLAVTLSEQAEGLDRDDVSRTAGIVTTAIFTGMRIGEILALKWKYVDFARRRVHVRHSVDGRGGLGPPKSKAGVRDIPVAPVLMRFLEDRHATLSPDPEAFVFHAWQSNRAVNRQNFHKGGWHRILALTDLLVDGKPKYHFHHFRHFAASAFIEQNLPPKRIQEIMGHASITMTFDTYGHLFPDADQADNAARSIEEMLIGKTRHESAIAA